MNMVLREPSGTRPGGQQGARRRRRARRRARAFRALVGLLALLVIAIWLTGSKTSPLAPPTVSVRVTLPRLATPGASATAARVPALPWPKTGEAAVEIPAVGFREQSGPEHPVPVASMTKIMTAYVVLEDHPLALGQQGPSVTITEADAAQFGIDTTTDQANVELKQGEVLSEYQMLEGLLVHSANDVAYALACWDAGSPSAFVAKMNATAAALGMRKTHFEDASGFLPASVSTASDLLRVAAVAMEDPVFAQIVSMPSVTLPLAGTVESYTPLVGTTGVVGVKSGFTDAAGGGDVLAYRTSVDGTPFITLAAVTSQEGWTVLGASGREALALAKAAAAKVTEVVVAKVGTVVARFTVRSHGVNATTREPVRLLTLPGDPIRQSVDVAAPRSPARKGALVGNATFVLAAQRVSVPVRLSGRLP
jgi:D-alanyl-D-alanine carboxypeptidase (penicillin-binding protein 5/6)